MSVITFRDCAVMNQCIATTTVTTPCVHPYDLEVLSTRNPFQCVPGFIGWGRFRGVHLLGLAPCMRPCHACSTVMAEHRFLAVLAEACRVIPRSCLQRLGPLWYIGLQASKQGTIAALIIEPLRIFAVGKDPRIIESSLFLSPQTAEPSGSIFWTRFRLCIRFC
jgi:hypothetical protein